jgi:hypothetical protein
MKRTKHGFSPPSAMTPEKNIGEAQGTDKI